MDGGEMDNNQPKYFDDQGTEINPDLIPKPSLCTNCKKDGLRDKEIICNLNRMGQQGEEDFHCEAYEQKDE